MCRRKKRKQCKDSKYGCCIDKVTSAKGPFDKGKITFSPRQIIYNFRRIQDVLFRKRARKANLVAAKTVSLKHWAHNYWDARRHNAKKLYSDAVLIRKQSPKDKTTKVVRRHPRPACRPSNNQFFYKAKPNRNIFQIRLL